MFSQMDQLIRPVFDVLVPYGVIGIASCTNQVVRTDWNRAMLHRMDSCRLICYVLSESNASRSAK